MVLEKTLERPLDCKEIQPVHPKGDQSWIFIGMIDAEAPILWPPDAKNWLIGEDPDAGKDWRWEEKGTTEDEMVGWLHWLNGHVWVSSRNWWWTWKPGMLQSMGLQRVRHDWATEIHRIFWVCDRCNRRHLCARTEHVLQTHWASLCFPPGEQTLHFLETFFLVLWVLFSLEYVLLFYLIVGKVDLCGGSFRNKKFSNASFLKVLW